MQQLHLVGFTADMDGLLFSPRKGSRSGSFVVPFDDRLKDAIEEMARRRETNDDAGEEEADNGDQRRRPQSSLTPREMQARLRAGSTLAEVARDAGIDETWVEPFAVPILAERAEVVIRARQMTLSKARLGESAQPLGAAVRWNLAGKGLGLPEDTFDAAWTAWNVTNGSWIVRFSYMSRRRTQAAEWEVDLRAREVVARNRLASELGYVEPGQRRRARPLTELVEVRPAGANARAGARPHRDGASADGRRAGTQARKGAPSRRAGSGSKAAKKAGRNGTTGERHKAPATPAPAAATKPAATRAPAKAPAKPPAKASDKVPAKAPAKAQAKTRSKAPAETRSKAPAETGSKAPASPEPPAAAAPTAEPEATRAETVKKLAAVKKVAAAKKVARATTSRVQAVAAPQPGPAPAPAPRPERPPASTPVAEPGPTPVLVAPAPAGPPTEAGGGR